MSTLAGYIPRLIDGEIRDRLKWAGAVIVEGARACGKTESARQAAASEVRLDIDLRARAAIDVDPESILEGPTPRLIDEWQVEPTIWNHVRHAVDDRREPGQFILTGSATPADDATRHSGAGRFTRVRLRPMSLHEAGRSTGRISLAAVMAGEKVSSPDPDITLADVAEQTVRGGWPGFVNMPLREAARRVRGYLDEVQRVDIATVDGVTRNPSKVERVLQSLGRNVATQATVQTITADAGGTDGDGIDRHTVSTYLDALERTFVLENQPAWAPHMRSRYVLRRAPTRHFVDPSLAAAALRASPDALLRDLNTFGLLFESLAVRDVRVYSQSLEGTVRHYRDSDGLEVDLILELVGGRWAAFEVKLGGVKGIDQGAESLQKFAKRIDTTKSGEPAALGIITATGYGYTRKDGIHVIPIGALGP